MPSCLDTARYVELGLDREVLNDIHIAEHTELVAPVFDYVVLRSLVKHDIVVLCSLYKDTVRYHVGLVVVKLAQHLKKALAVQSCLSQNLLELGRVLPIGLAEVVGYG